jgi:hypothetical protein
LNTWLEAARFCADVQRVIALRMMRLASSDPLATTEAWQMVSEKFFAFEAKTELWQNKRPNRTLEGFAGGA